MANFMGDPNALTPQNQGMANPGIGDNGSGVGGFLNNVTSQPNFWSNLMNFGASTLVAANQRTPQGFLANGPGPWGSIGAGILGAQEQARLRQQMQENFARTRLYDAEARQKDMEARYTQAQYENYPNVMRQLQAGRDLPMESAASSPTTSSASATGLAPAVAKIESGGNPFIGMNDYRFLGKYQFGAAALKSAGLYAPGKDENLDKNQWQGTINVPGFPAMTSYQFMNSEPAQDKAFSIHMDHLKTEAESRGFPAYYGQTIGGVPLNESTVLGMMHFAGPRGTDQFIKSGGRWDRQDANNTKTSVYGRRIAADMGMIGSGGSNAGQSGGGGGPSGGYVGGPATSGIQQASYDPRAITPANADIPMSASPGGAADIPMSASPGTPQLQAGAGTDSTGRPYAATPGIRPGESVEEYNGRTAGAPAHSLPMQTRPTPTAPQRMDAPVIPDPGGSGQMISMNEVRRQMVINDRNAQLAAANPKLGLHPEIYQQRANEYRRVLLAGPQAAAAAQGAFPYEVEKERQKQAMEAARSGVSPQGVPLPDSIQSPEYKTAVAGGEAAARAPYQMTRAEPGGVVVSGTGKIVTSVPRYVKEVEPSTGAVFERGRDPLTNLPQGEPVQSELSPYQKELQTQTGIEVAKRRNEINDEAQHAQQSNAQMSDVIRYSKNINQGWGANEFLLGKRALQGALSTIGVKTPELEQEIGNAQAWKSAIGAAARTAMAQAHLRSNQELGATLDSFPTLTGVEAGTQLTLAPIIAHNDFLRARQQMAAGWDWNKNPNFEADFNNHVTEQAFTVERLNQSPEGRIANADWIRRIGESPGGDKVLQKLQSERAWAREHGLFDNMSVVQ